ncbi:hypothetical protein GLOTRDRAFT_134726 [Gloeophyllum trabeum ATCC 11539]|uniref:Uncharacterized protein n=1 Tax=Gloeophyllum trabeum (strain ATCC 11539 / FP-39264 / Madison 617) TaxID=670483 RepID=S7R5P1_GLOTA|nr:uncharacterized protein GLOTRDRAFT_134726 [Gloeophyllum trabeum ATCC 11539]EPQ49700.1 hypothetical protein GLOTRDRAFT_134726 [Gloeophyllum trabeum ATCC 11539]
MAGPAVHKYQLWEDLLMESPQTVLDFGSWDRACELAPCCAWSGGTAAGGPD